MGGRLVTVPCGYRAVGVVNRMCVGGDSGWGPVDVTGCELSEENCRVEYKIHFYNHS